MSHQFPVALDSEKVGEYPSSVKSGGGYVWDAVLEYRVWCQPEPGSSDDGDCYYAFATYESALEFSRSSTSAEEPLALVLQEEYIDEPSPGEYIHVKERRLTEWPVEFLTRPRRTERTISDFLDSDAPSNRLEILRGTVKPLER